MEKKIKRKDFYKNVKFKDKESKKYLKEPIYHFAMQSDGIFPEFEQITNYVSHATHEQHMANGKVFNVAYPVTISGTSISQIQIEDSKGDIFNISLLPPNKIIYYEKYESYVNFFVATLSPNDDEKRFYTKRVRYFIQDLSF